MATPLLLGIFFAFVMAAVIGAAALYERWNTEPSAALADNEPSAADGMLLAIGGAFAALQKRDDGLRSLLFRAGFRSPSAVIKFNGLRIAAGLGVAVVLLSALALFSQRGGVFVPALAGLGFGYLLPNRVLEWQVRRRAARLRSALPPALDLIVLALEAGQTIDQGILEAARSLGRVYPDLSSELTFCSLEMRAGTPRAEALRRMGERCGDEEVRRLVTVLVDGERFGTSLSPALRSHAHYLRTRMRHRAQEASRKLTVKLVIPVFFLIFPSVLLVTLGPAYLQLQQFLGELLK